MPLADLHRRLHALVGVCRRQLDVDDRGVRARQCNLTQQRRWILALPDYVEALVGEEPGQAFAQQRHVFGDHDPHQRVSSTIAPSVPSATLDSSRSGGHSVDCMDEPVLGGCSRHSGQPNLRPESRAGHRELDRDGAAVPEALGGVDAIGEHAVRRGLERLGQPVELPQLETQRHGARVRELAHGRHDPAVAERDRMNAVSDRSELVESGEHFVSRLGGRRIARRRQPDGERDQSLLGAVVQVSLEPTPFGVCDLDDPCPRRREVDELGAQTCARRRVLEC